MKEEVLNLNVIGEDKDVFDADALAEKIKLFATEEIVNDLFQWKTFSKKSNAVRIKALRERGYSDADLVSLKAEIDRNYEIKAANSKLSLTEGEKWRLMFFPLFFSRKLLAGFEKDGCERKIEEYENAAFVRRYTSTVQYIPVALAFFIALIVVDFVMQILN